MPTAKIKYASDDGFAVRFTGREAWACYADGKWREISLTEAASDGKQRPAVAAVAVAELFKISVLG